MAGHQKSKELSLSQNNVAPLSLLTSVVLMSVLQHPLEYFLLKMPLH